MIYNELEKTTIFPLRDYVDTHRNHVYQMTFADGECAECTWVTDYESSNEEEFGISERNDKYCEFNASGFDITKVIIPGKWSQYGYINLGYWDFPVKIVDITDNHVVYEASQAENKVKE